MLDQAPMYALAALAVVLVGISKSGFGGGAGAFAVPLLSLVMSPARAAAILLPILCLMDILSVRAYWRQWDWTNLARLLPAAVLGIALGTMVFGALDADRLRLLIGMVAIAFCAHAALPRRAGDAPARPPGRASAVVWGGLAGFTSFIAHAGGPPLSMHLLPQRLDRTAFVGTSVAFFLVVNYVKLVPYGWLGLLDGGNLGASLALAPFAPIGIGLGLWLHRRVDDRVFYRIVYVLLFATGVKLLWDGTGGH
jgi:hypothetical protein